MNDQTTLSEADQLRLANLNLRSQVLEQERKIIALETRLFQQHLHATYGNPGERLEIAPDNSIVRTPIEAK